jgi:hypothetical protein
MQQDHIYLCKDEIWFDLKTEFHVFATDGLQGSYLLDC